MVNLKGGRGNHLPYEVTHIRVPVPMKEAFTLIVEAYKKHVEEGGDPYDFDYPPPPPRGNEFSPDDIFELANSALKMKKGARETMIKMLTRLLKDDFDISKLK
jgi:hypothetical protein